jgi:hypothetical protein
MQQTALVADLGGFPYHNPRAMVEHDPFPNGSGGVKVHSEDLKSSVIGRLI